MWIDRPLTHYQIVDLEDFVIIIVNVLNKYGQ